jgi:NADH-quinone oxidoreductase subunit N
MGGFDAAEALRGLAWLKPELLLVLLGFVLLALGLGLPEGRRRAAGWVALAGLAIAAVLVASYVPGFPFGGLKISDTVHGAAFPDGAGHPAFVVDGFALVLKAVILLGAALSVLLALRFLDQERVQSGEFYAMLVFATLGAMFLASGNDFATLFIGLETLALSSYVLVGFTRDRQRSNEAALKYFLLGTVASGILLYGVSLVYATTGSFHLDGIAEAIASGPRGPYALLQVGAILVLVGLSFKLALVPFHMWAPDAYEGAPTPVAAFLATAAKAGAFAMLLRVFLHGFNGLAEDWIPLVALLAAASMTLGNVAALLQDNVKRMLAYSSIAHAGYMLMGVLAVGASRGDVVTWTYGLTSVVLYLLVYTLANIGAFGTVALLRARSDPGDTLKDFRGLSRIQPVPAAAMVLFLLSLAGIPATAGFIGKWWLFGAAIKARFEWLAVLAVLNSAISLYYYARVVVAMYMHPDEAEGRLAVPAGLAAALGVAALLTLGIGLYPQPFIRFAQAALIPLLGR